MKKLLAAFAVVGILVAGIAHADVIADRKAIMKEGNAASMAILAKTAKGEMEYDQEAVMAAFTAMREGTANFHEFFPEGSETGGETTASPAIWTDMEGFQAALAEFHADLDAALAAEPATMDEFVPVFQEVAGNCQSCHQEFRVQKN
jgi:cytochrome c556